MRVAAKNTVFYSVWTKYMSPAFIKKILHYMNFNFSQSQKRCPSHYKFWLILVEDHMHVSLILTLARPNIAIAFFKKLKSLIYRRIARMVMKCMHKNVEGLGPLWTPSGSRGSPSGGAGAKPLKAPGFYQIFQSFSCKRNHATMQLHPFSPINTKQSKCIYGDLRKNMIL